MLNRTIAFNKSIFDLWDKLILIYLPQIQRDARAYYNTFRYQFNRQGILEKINKRGVMINLS